MLGRASTTLASVEFLLWVVSGRRYVYWTTLPRQILPKSGYAIERACFLTMGFARRVLLSLNWAFARLTGIWRTKLTLGSSRYVLHCRLSARSMKKLMETNTLGCR